MPFLDLAVEPAVAADDAQEIGEMAGVAGGAGGGAQLFSGLVVDGVAAAVDGEGAGLAVEDDVGDTLGGCGCSSGLPS